MPTEALKVVVAKLAKLVTAKTVVVAALRETLPPPTALKMPPMVEDAVTEREPEVVALPNMTLPTALKIPVTVVEPTLETANSVVVAVPLVVEEMRKTVG